MKERPHRSGFSLDLACTSDLTATSLRTFLLNLSDYHAFSLSKAPILRSRVEACDWPNGYFLALNAKGSEFNTHSR